MLAVTYTMVILFYNYAGQWNKDINSWCPIPPVRLYIGLASIIGLGVIIASHDHPCMHIAK